MNYDECMYKINSINNQTKNNTLVIIDITLITQNFNTEIEKNMNDSMDELCKFLNSTGKELEDDMELRPFFALPFIENPCTEPSLSKVFEKSWVDKVTENLYLFLKKYEQQVSKLCVTTRIIFIK